MAKIEVPMSSAAQRGSQWENASAKAAPSGISGSSLGPVHSSVLQPQQFGSKPASLSANMNSYYSSGSFPKQTTAFLHNRAGVAAGNKLKTGMSKSHNAGMANMWSSSSPGSSGSAPNPVTPNVSPSSSAKGSAKNSSKRVLGRALAVGIKKIRASSHAGKNAAHLKAMTGTK